MTEAEIRQRIVNMAVQHLGRKASDGSHREIIDIYNGQKPLPRGYRVKYTDAWCAAFVSCIAILCGCTDIMFPECGCGEMTELYRKAGRWQENDAYRPKPGDIVMYDWKDSGKGDCTGYPRHVGIIVSVTGNTIKVIEGNKSNAVGYRDIAVDGRYIRGYGLPDYAGKAAVTSGMAADSARKVAYARSKARNLAGTYIVQASDGLNLRYEPGKLTKDNRILTIPNGRKVVCYGYYTAVDGVNWLLVAYQGKTGFVSGRYLVKM